MQEIAVIKREDGVTNQVVETKEGEPDALITPMSVTRAIATRAARVYVQTLTSFLTVVPVVNSAGLLPEGMMMPTEFGLLVWAGLQIALAPAAMSVLWNAGELLARLDEKAPKWRA